MCYTAQVAPEILVVKPVYNDHLGDEVPMVVIDRWFLYRRPVYNGQNC